MLGAISMTVMLVAALACFAALVAPRLGLLLAARADDRFDRLGARLLGALKLALGQWRMPRDPVAGIAHIFIFSGFLVVSIATVDHFLHPYGLRFPGLVEGGFAAGYGVVKDVFEVLVLLGVTYGLWRRLGPRPSRVGRSWEGVFVLAMIFFLMVSDFLISGGRLVADAAATTVTPMGRLLAVWLAPLGKSAAGTIGEVAYWGHCAAVLVFLNFLPLGKHFHVITAIPNVFFRDLKPYGQVAKLDLENSERFGIRSTADLSWSMVLNLYSCTECGRCEVFCPTVLTDKPLSHRQLNLDLKQALYEDQKVLLSGNAEQRDGLASLVGGRINPETVWACTTCGSCEQECPVFIDNVPRIIEMRQNRVLMEGEVPPELARAYKGMENNNNPWGIGFDKRDAWAEGLDIPRFAEIMADGRQEAPLLYWIGCAGSFDDRNKKITLAMVQILKAAGIEFAILGKEEGCSGDPARRTGNEYLFQALAQANIETLKGYKVRKILTHCPHCLHTLKTEYPQFGGEFEVVHHTQFIEELLAAGRLRLGRWVDATVAMHDSCYLGRYHNIYDAPRNVARAVPGVSVVELPRHHSRSVCCGAGGGRFWMEETIGERINVHRAKEVAAADTQRVCSSCPFCLTMLKDGLAQINKESVATQDIAELVAQALAVSETPQAAEAAADQRAN